MIRDSEARLINRILQAPSTHVEYQPFVLARLMGNGLVDMDDAREFFVVTDNGREEFRRWKGRARPAWKENGNDTWHFRALGEPPPPWSGKWT